MRYALRVSLRECFFENFAGDLEYHPRRAALYLVLAVAAAAFWFLSPAETKFTATCTHKECSARRLLALSSEGRRSPSPESAGKHAELIAAL